MKIINTDIKNAIRSRFFKANLSGNLTSANSRLLSPENQEASSCEVVLIGNPNSGKSALFNLLTGSYHKVGNYPGVTVEQKSARLKGHNIVLNDLPGTYSLNANSLDEKVVADIVQNWRNAAHRPMAVIVVVNTTHLSRSLYLTLQILEWGIPAIVVLNMMDEVRKKGITVDRENLRRHLQAYAVIPASAKTGEGISEIIDTLATLQKHPPVTTSHSRLVLKEKQAAPLTPLIHSLEKYQPQLLLNPLSDSIRLIAEENYLKYLQPFLTPLDTKQISKQIEQIRQQYIEKDISFNTIESDARYAYIDSFLEDTASEEQLIQKTFSENLDSVISHPIAGPVILLFILGFIFNTIFSWAELPMEWIETGVNWIALWVQNTLPDGELKNLLVDGVIVGVGNVVVFLPQIIILIFFLSLLEDSGYIARMAFILDRLMGKIGLHGKAVLPMLSGFACAIPAIMASRTIENWRDRLMTILLIPLMSCSARLPVYTLLISAFIPQKTIWGFIQLQGLVLMGMYLLGFVTAVVISLFVKKFIPEKKVSHFILELPPYRTPMFRSIWRKVYDSGKLFLVNAGSIILAISIVLWFLASYPKTDDQHLLSNKEKVAQSYAGRLGGFVEPVLKPLGFDWKIGVGLIASFAAREVLVSTFATIYNIESENDEDIIPLVKAMSDDRYPNGKPVFTLLVALSLLVYFVYAAQCMATFAIVKRETNSWRWPMVMIIYMTTLAFAASFTVYQGGKLLGLE